MGKTIAVARMVKDALGLMAEEIWKAGKIFDRLSPSRMRYSTQYAFSENKTKLRGNTILKGRTLRQGYQQLT